MFEPIGGSAPKYTGQGVINPLAAVCAMAMMLETLGEEDAAKKVDAPGLLRDVPEAQLGIGNAERKQISICS